MRYAVVIHRSRYGYHVECPALPGCVSQGETLRGALENIKDAIRTYLLMIRREILRKRTVEVRVAV